MADITTSCFYHPLSFGYEAQWPRKGPFAYLTTVKYTVNRKLQRKLYNRFPSFFWGRGLPITQSCMPFGCECGDGWYHIIFNACLAIEKSLDLDKKKQIKLVKIQNRNHKWNDFIQRVADWFNDDIDLMFNSSSSSPILQLRCWISSRIRIHLTMGLREQFIFTQIKEKYGTLQLYTNWSSTNIDSIVQLAEELSEKTCETCGKPGKIDYKAPWMNCFCSSCRKAHNNR